jgi:hypothetical protein
MNWPNLNVLSFAQEALDVRQKRAPGKTAGLVRFNDLI